MINIDHLRDLVVQPTLAELGLWSQAAEALVLATALEESGLRHLRQLGAGPALGLWQMEPATHDDIWDNWLAHRPRLAAQVQALRVPGRGAGELIWNLRYGAAMCRLHYRRVPAPLPALDDADAMGRYWKDYYNTHLGAGDPSRFAAGYAGQVRHLYP